MMSRPTSEIDPFRVLVLVYSHQYNMRRRSMFPSLFHAVYHYTSLPHTLLHYSVYTSLDHAPNHPAIILRIHPHLYESVDLAHWPYYFSNIQ